ncbi:MAG: dethiobiotin synthase [Campylobacterales bacterium]|nr:dethiobiotin synthase [Campylobacterales bacterium]
MAKRIFVTATNTNVGKTHTTLQLMRHYADQGLRVCAYKPIETGVENHPVDAQALYGLMRTLNPHAASLHVSDVVTFTFALPAAPYVANQGRLIERTRLLEAATRLEAHCDILLIEGAGGLLVPVDEAGMMIDLIPLFEAKALLVTHASLGCINDTLLSLEALQNRQIAHEWIVNLHGGDNTFDRISAPYFNTRFPGYFRTDQGLEALAKALIN